MNTDNGKAYQALLKENALLEQRNRVLKLELESATAKIARMEQWTALRLGKILVTTRGLSGLLALPGKLWELRRNLKKEKARAPKIFPDIPVVEMNAPFSGGKLVLFGEQIYENLRIAGKIRETLVKNLEGDRCILWGTLPSTHAYLPLQCWYDVEGFSTILSARLEFTGSIDVIGYLYFYDEESEEISAAPFYRKKTDIIIPERAKYISIALRVKGSGQTFLTAIHLNAQKNDVSIKLPASSLASQIIIPKEGRKFFSIGGGDTGFQLESTLPKDKHIYLPIRHSIDKKELGTYLYAYMSFSGVMDLMGCIIFLDSKKEKISHTTFKAGEKVISVPVHTTSAKLALRIKGPGRIDNLCIEVSNSPLSVHREKDFSAEHLTSLRHMKGGQSLLGEQFHMIMKDNPGEFAAWLKQIRVATIMDEFTWRSYSPEANMTQLTPGGWYEELETFKPALLFVESAWRGKDELWKNCVHKVPQELRGILQWCDEHKVPTVFWNKEDPIHFETFINVAALFDFVFSYDFNCVARYKTILGHERVYYLPMGVQPCMFNPVEKYDRIDGFCFAGSYYARYPERTRDLEGYLLELPQFKPLEIYDRQYGRTDPAYMFPEKYLPFIKGNLPYDQIDKAYKGYTYAINLNSLKQAQSLARRVYELMACNTLVVSNYSHGVRLQMGDLIILSDSAKEVIQRIRALEAEPLLTEKLRLAALRKAMSENTYKDRLAYLIAKVCDIELPTLLPPIYVIAYVSTRQEAEEVYRNYAWQGYTNKYLLLISDELMELFNGDKHVRMISPQDFPVVLGDMPDNAWVAYFVSRDFYGVNYLIDLAMATRYTKVSVVGKSRFYAFTKGEIVLCGDGEVYTEVESFPARRGMASVGILKREGWLFGQDDTLFPAFSCFSIDMFNYLENGMEASEEGRTSVCDIEGLNTGISTPQMQEYAEKLRPLEQDETNLPSLGGRALFEEFAKTPTGSLIDASSTVNGALHLRSRLPTGRHEYRYGKSQFAFDALSPQGKPVKLHLQSSLGLELEGAYFLLDRKRQKLQSGLFKANTNVELPLCEGSAFVRFALRVSGSGEADVDKLFFGHRVMEPDYILGTEDTLVVTNHYPSYDNLYRNAFVHSRVRAYKREGFAVSVFQFQSGQKLFFEEFEGIDVIRGGASALRKILEQGKVRRVLVHFLDAAMWDVLKTFAHTVRIIVWIHGSEIHPWFRRKYNFTDQELLEKAKVDSKVRMKFWQSVFSATHLKIHFVFVSKTFSQEIFEDYHLHLRKESYSIIHNPIDSNIFSYCKKESSQRYNILSIRPYASRQYANDILVEVLHILAKRKDFSKFKIHIIGSGKLFDETVKSVRCFNNLILENKFVTHLSIAQLHKHYGVFLCPTRWDSQGVSRDEAMASGLVPVTNAVAAVPEFVDHSCGILAPFEDAEAMATGISRLVDNPELFVSMSQAAAKRVRRQSAVDIIVKQEMKLIQGE